MNNFNGASKLAETNNDVIQKRKNNNFLYLTVLGLVFVSCIALIFFLLTNNKPQLPNNQTTNSISGQNQTTNPAQNRELVTFIDPYLPDFEISYPISWELKTKQFGKEDDIGFESGYKPSCDKRCLGLRFSKEEVSLDFVFQIAFDDMGMMCSNSVQYQDIGNNWFRIKDKSKYYYAYGVSAKNTLGIKLNHTTTNGECFQFENSKESIIRVHGDVWKCTENTSYKMCDSGTGLFITMHSLVENEVNDGVSILMEKPKVNGDPDEETLKELDEIVKSIKFKND